MGQKDPQYTAMEYNSAVERLQDTEYPMLKGKTYLDHGGTTLYAKSLIEAFSADLAGNLYGNPHSASTPAKFSGDIIDEIRVRTLRFFGADPEHYDLVFVANATAAIKVVMNSFRDLSTPDDTVSTLTPGSPLAGAAEAGFWYGYHVDSHNSLIGVRESSDKNHHLFCTDAEVDAWLDPTANPSLNPTGKLGLFAYPGQSNMTGRRLPTNWPAALRNSPHARHHDTYTLLDAAALATTLPLHHIFADPAAAPDFTSLSFYKIFGFPDLGGLIVRRASGKILTFRRYFGGGTVSMVMVHGAHPWFRSHDELHESLEDGTLPFHNIIALGHAMATHERLYARAGGGGEPGAPGECMRVISRHTTFLAKRLFDALVELRHTNGRAVCRVYMGRSGESAYGDASTQGATVSFNVVRADGTYVPYTSAVERAANSHQIFVRSGQLCNPGGVAVHLGLERWHLYRLWAYGHHCGASERSGTEIYHGKPTGVVRVSMGAMTTIANVDSLMKFLREEFVDVPVAVSKPARAILLNGEGSIPVIVEEEVGLFNGKGERVVKIKNEPIILGAAEAVAEVKTEPILEESYDGSIYGDEKAEESFFDKIESSETTSEDVSTIEQSQGDLKSYEIVPMGYTPLMTRAHPLRPATSGGRLTEDRPTVVDRRTPDERWTTRGPLAERPAIERPAVERSTMERPVAMRPATAGSWIPEQRKFTEERRAPEERRITDERRLPDDMRMTNEKRPTDERRALDDMKITSERRVADEKRAPEEKKRPVVHVISVQEFEMSRAKIVIRPKNGAAAARKRDENHGIKRFLSAKGRLRRTASNLN